MACLDENQLVAFFSPGRAPDLVAAVEAHTSECKACREALAQYAKISVEGGTAQTHRNDDSVKLYSAAAAPSLTPSGAEASQRSASAFVAKLTGTVLKGKWHIERLLGVGGMAYVFAARHRNGRRVAIKCMRPELAVETSFVERFLREGYVANKIDHPGAVAILDDDIMDDGTPFLVMELLTGRSLRDHLIDRPLTLQGALAAIADVLDVLSAAHDKGIVHRDLKPDNLFLTESGTVKVLDFGIARLKERATSEHATQFGTTMGTVGFMPPEQARGLTDEIDARSDVWAVGATLYALLTGRSLHEAKTTNEALLLAMTTPVQPMAELLPALPVEVQSLLDRALAFEKGDRYLSARAMKVALDAARAALANTIIELEPAVLAPPAPMEPVQFTELIPSHATGTLLARAFARRGSSSSITPPRPRTAQLVVALVVGASMLVLVIAFVIMGRDGARAPTSSASDLVTATAPLEAPAPRELALPASGAAAAAAATPDAAITLGTPDDPPLVEAPGARVTGTAPADTTARPPQTAAKTPTAAATAAKTPTAAATAAKAPAAAATAAKTAAAAATATTPPSSNATRDPLGARR